MVHIAQEMKRRNMQQPLLIGGATTSRIHTAVKIAPHYDQGVVHVLDASRSVTVAGALLNKEQKKEFLQHTHDEYIKVKQNFDSKKPIKQYISYADAVVNGVKIDWTNYAPPVPSFTGTKVFTDFPLSRIREYIDWKPFFIAWEMHGNFPDILHDPVVGTEATKLYNDANALLDTILKENWLSPAGVIGFWEAARSNADTVHVNNGGAPIQLEFLRQQIKKAATQPNLSLADFIQPSSQTGDTGATDHIGAFAVTIKGIEPHIRRFQEQHDDYNKIMMQALSDRLAEAFAECLHAAVRREYWGYAHNEQLTNEDLIKERYTGIRPAPGYPACPDHTEKYKLFTLLDATKNTGIELTESLAMYPAASVCGCYFSHPQCQYFGVGKIGRDQLEDYAARKGWTSEEAERWLRPNLE
jgi:5-methyltetrahydrofolate--homocysteine methyltransferase